MQFLYLDSVDEIAWASSAAYQLRIASEAVNLLKPGGILIYSTCTLSYAENEGVIEKLIGWVRFIYFKYVLL